jgi:hypothetical protein
MRPVSLHCGRQAFQVRRDACGQYDWRESFICQPVSLRNLLGFINKKASLHM